MNEKNNKIFNKFYMIIPGVLFIVLLFVMTTGSFANSDITFYNGNTYSLPDFSSYVENKDYCIFYGTNKNMGLQFILVPYDSSSYSIKVEKSAGFYSLRLSNRFDIIKYNYYCCSLGSSSWSQGQTSDYSGYYFNGGIVDFLTTKDIYDQNGDVVFQKAPQATHLAQVVEQAKPEKTMEEIVGILPVVLITLISLIALWKGLQAILRILYRA